jgi:aldehyde dehydrogenase (NAD+)
MCIRDGRQMKAKVKPGKLFIDGKWRDAITGKTFPTINPATEEVITQVAEGDEGDIDLAVKAARKAFEEGPWSTVAAADRGKILWKIGDLIMKYADELAELETLDTGKPYAHPLGSRNADIPLAAECFQYYAGWATKIYGETIPVRGNFLNYTLREPVGVVGSIVPWNFPFLLIAWKLGPALAAGNTVVLKPSEVAPLTALRLVDILQEAGLPKGVVNVITGYGETAGASLVKHPGVDKIAFTGHYTTGQEIMRNAADSLKLLSLEQGGKSPNIVFADADLESAAAGSLWGIFWNKGEACTAGSRLFVERSIHDKFMEKLVGMTDTLVAGDPFDPNTSLGPVVSNEQLEKDLHYIDVGKREAKLVKGGERLDIGTGKGYFLQPTIFDEVNNKMTIAQDEIFGPVLATIEFKDLDEAIEIANDTIYGLAAAVWTRDIKKAHYAAKKLKAGTVWINSYHNYDMGSPFGGYKMSGFGRELGMQAMDLYTQVKSVFVDLNM